MNTRRLIELFAPENIKDACIGACATRGRYKNFLLESAPKEPARKAAWLAMMSAVCPARMSIGSVFMLDSAQRAMYELVSYWATHQCRALTLAEPFMRWGLAEYNWPPDLRDRFNKEMADYEEALK